LNQASVKGEQMSPKRRRFNQFHATNRTSKALQYVIELLMNQHRVALSGRKGAVSHRASAATFTAHEDIW
jgi:hypothetical protein